MTTERPEAFNFFGPRALSGPEPKAGDAAPDFALLTNKSETVSLASFAGKPTLISVVPSLDTGVCSKQTVRFNEEAATMAEQANFLTVSADLPFAQARFCSSNGTSSVVTLSDHRDMNFGAAYGTLVGDFRIESRAVFVLDGAGVVRYVEYVPTAGQEPNYEAAMGAVREVLG